MKFNPTRVIACGLLALAAHTAQAAGTENFAGFTYGKSYDGFSNSGALKRNLDHHDTDGVIRNSGTWGIRGGQESDSMRYYATYDQVRGSKDGLRIKQQNLLGSYDLFFPVASGTKLFGGGTLGLTNLATHGSDLSHANGLGYAAGVQAGVLQRVGDRTSLELGYRYLLSNAKTDVKRDDTKIGSTKLDGSSTLYLGVNVYF